MKQTLTAVTVQWFIDVESWKFRNCHVDFCRKLYIRLSCIPYNILISIFICTEVELKFSITIKHFLGLSG